MKSLTAITLIAFGISGPAAYADLCEDIQSFVTHTDAMDASLPNGGRAASCRLFLVTSGQTQAHCSWTFPYRAPAATEAFQDLLAAVTACEDSAEGEPDSGVNHPDTYELQTFRRPDHEVSVSLKDKAALGETYVFLRVAPLN